MKPNDLLTIEIPYERPAFEFPNLNGESGNPIVYWPKAISAIRSNGFKKEANFIKQHASSTAGPLTIPNIPYEKQFDYLAHYLNFVDQEEIVNEDSEYVYIKRRKNNQPITSQISFFNINNIEELDDLINSDVDLSTTNCYGRNILYYLDSPELLTHFLNLNKEKQWVDLFYLDNFNSTALTLCSNMDNFIILLNEMYSQSPELTKMIFTGRDSLNHNASGVYLSYISDIFKVFNKKTIDEIKISEWEKLSTYLSPLKDINPVMYKDIFNTIETMPIIKDDKTGKAKQIYLYSLLNASIDKDDKKTTYKKSKI